MPGGVTGAGRPLKPVIAVRDWALAASYSCTADEAKEGFMMTKKKGNAKKATAIRDLSVRTGSGVKGGSKAEAQILEFVSSTVRTVLESIGQGLTTAARNG